MNEFFQSVSQQFAQEHGDKGRAVAWLIAALVIFLGCWILTLVLRWRKARQEFRDFAARHEIGGAELQLVLALARRERVSPLELLERVERFEAATAKSLEGPGAETRAEQIATLRAALGYDQLPKYAPLHSSRELPAGTAVQIRPRLRQAGRRPASSSWCSSSRRSPRASPAWCSRSRCCWPATRPTGCTARCSSAAPGAGPGAPYLRARRDAGAHGQHRAAAPGGGAHPAALGADRRSASERPGLARAAATRRRSHRDPARGRHARFCRSPRSCRCSSATSSTAPSPSARSASSTCARWSARPSRAAATPTSPTSSFAASPPASATGCGRPSSPRSEAAR